MKLLARWGILALSVWVATALVPGITVHGGAWKFLWVALLLGLINSFFGSFLKLMTFPFVLLTFGLFSIVINAAMLMLTARWSTALDVKNFWSAFFGSLVISLISSILNRSFVKRPLR
ncbi:MAG: phage holin family protein [Actinomycetes bacterium]|jgi:putative membrane protein